MNTERRWSTDDGDTFHMLSKSELFWKKAAIVSMLFAAVVWIGIWVASW